MKSRRKFSSRRVGAWDAFGAAVLAAAMDTDAWARVRSRYVTWAHQASADWVADVLDRQAGRLIGLSGADRERMRLIVLMDWRARLGDLILTSPTTGFGGFWVVADDARELLPDAAQAWAAAHKEENVHTSLPFAEVMVGARRWHAAQDPDPDLAGALVDLATALEKAGRPLDAAAAKAEAVDLYRQLARTDLDAHGADLAWLLDGHMNARDDLDVLADLAEVYTGLADLDPAAFGDELGSTYRRIATALRHADRLEESAAAYRQETDTYRRLVAGDPKFTKDLALACQSLSGCLWDAGRRDEALTAQAEAVTMRRLLADSDPAEDDRHTRPGDPHNDLAEALATYATRLADADRADEALAAAEESVAVRRRAVDLEPGAGRQDLGIAMANLARDLKKVDRRDEANALEEEALTIFRPMAEERPHLLGATLNNYACSLSIQGRYDAAAAASAEAVAIYRRLVAGDQGRYTATLAQALWTFAEVRTEGRLDLDAALAAAEETVALYEKLSADDPTGYAESLRGARTAVDEVRAVR